MAIDKHKRVRDRLEDGWYQRTRYDLEDQFDRFTDDYDGLMNKITSDLNSLDWGMVTQIDMDLIKQQLSHMIFYSLKLPSFPPGNGNGNGNGNGRSQSLAKERQVPFDILYLKRLWSQVRAPTLMKLRQGFKYLMNEHRTVVTELITMQTRQRSISLDRIDLKKEIQVLEKNVNVAIARARVARSKSQKLDHLTNALQELNRQKLDYKYLRDMVRDPYHLRYTEVINWMRTIVKKRNKGELEEKIEENIGVINTIFKDVLARMSELSGIPFGENKDITGPHFSWYSLGLEQPRNEYFSTNFLYDERTRENIQRKTFLFIQTLFDADNFRKEIENLDLESPLKMEESLFHLASVYMNIDNIIVNYHNPEGELQRALSKSKESGIQTESGLRTAEAWAEKNHKALLLLRSEILDTLIKAKRENPTIAMPLEIDQVIKGAREMAKRKRKNFKESKKLLPELQLRLKLLIMAAERDLTRYDDHFNGSLDDETEETFQEDTLSDMLKVYQQIKSRPQNWSLLDFGKLEAGDEEARNQADQNFDAILEVENGFETLLRNCEDALMEYYRKIPYATPFPQMERMDIEERKNLIWVSKEEHRQVFEIKLDQILRKVRLLDYSAIHVDHYRKLFKSALQFDHNESLFMLDRLFHEIRCLPRSDHLLEALTHGWKDDLNNKDLKEKENFVIHNNDELQLLLNDVRAQIREKLQTEELKPRRLRMEVFGLADYYAESLKDVFQSQIRLLPKVATRHEMNLMLKSIESIESQVHEAQKWTAPGKQAEIKLAEIVESKMFSVDFTDLLMEDIQANRSELSELLQYISGEMGQVREVIKRFRDQGDDDNSFLEMVIEYQDIQEMSKIYKFLDNVTNMDLKRFAMAYKRKNDLLSALILPGKQPQFSPPPELLKRLSKSICKDYQTKKILPPEIRLWILDQVPMIMEAECRLLSYMLNFVRFGESKNKNTFRIPLLMMEHATKWGLTDSRRRMAIRYWIRVRDYLNKYEPKSFENNYNNNRQAFFTEQKNMIGDKL